MFEKVKANETAINPEMNEFDILQQYLIKVEGLTRVLKKETEYFLESKMEQAEALLAPKNKLIDEIEEYKTTLISNKEFLSSLPENQKQRIKTLNEQMIEASEENYREALKAKEVNRMIMESVSAAVEKSRASNNAYSNKGEAYSKPTEFTPMALNESI